MNGLSDRLRLIATLVPNGARVCDVGADHGYLAAALHKSGRVGSVIATDLRERPLAHAKQSLIRLGAEKVELRLCDGLAAIKPGEADTIVIAGMGGEVIAGILERAPFVKNPAILLLLQPMTSSWELRRYLLCNGFAIEKEPTLEENGKVYSVICARYDGVVRPADPFYCCIGKISAKSSSDFAYIRKQYKRCEQCACRLAAITGKEQEQREYESVAARLKQILEEHHAI